MARSPNQKLKLLYLKQIFEEKTDEDHPLSLAELMAELKNFGITAERKSLYDDIEALRRFGMNIMVVRSRTTRYFLAERVFELPELRLLVDSVQSSKFITHKKSSQLISKIERLTSVHAARTLHRQVFVTNRIKTMNESIYYNIDAIHSGIAAGRKISFRYYHYAVSKEKIFRRGGARYVVSPWTLTWNDDNYYMIAYDDEADRMKHFRVDKMTEIEVTDAPRGGIEHYKKLDIGQYLTPFFSMYSGREETVRLEMKNHLAGVVIDRFGKEVILVPSGEDSFTFQVPVIVSPLFYAWVAGFGSEAKILAPQSVAEEFQTLLRDTLAQYKSPR
ncbi:MAG TPA: WYL domain-containing protein [Papillibacter sp.]|nr:WYL domain-containing protein [Papillibacter sp.]